MIENGAFKEAGLQCKDYISGDAWQPFYTYSVICPRCCAKNSRFR